MRIKSYTAESVAEALKLVRTEMGRDAILLRTREFLNSSGSEKIEVTACSKGEVNQVKALKNNNSAASKENKIERLNETITDESTSVSNVKAELVSLNKRLDNVEEKLTEIIDQLLKNSINFNETCANVEQNAH
jgi:flagellar biosynthesis protein FlhF